MPSSFCYSELHTRDLPRARSFYSELFGWKFDDLPIPGIQYATLQGVPGGAMADDVFGVRVVQGYADPALARAADSVLAKVQMVLPERLRAETATRSLLVPAMHPGKSAPHLGTLREAIRARRRISFGYCDAEGRKTERTARPLAVAFWGKVWSLASWCETRRAFRGFRLDRMQNVTLGAAFQEDEDKSLDAFMRHVTAEVAQRKRVD